MKYTQIAADTFQKLQLNAGILLSDFTPTTGAFEKANILGATSGGVKFTAVPSYKDFGEDIDNCPKNTKELKKIESIEVKMGGTYISADTAKAKSLVAGADVAGNKVTPRNYLKDEDFADIWWVGDYSDENNDDTAGFIAIKLINALNTSGFSLQSGDKSKGQFAFEYTGHFSINDPDTVPYELYIKSGSASSRATTQTSVTK